MARLTPKQLEAAASIARGLSPSAIAKSLDVSNRTIQRWRQLPEFVQAVEDIRDRATVKAINEISKEIRDRIVCLIPKSLGVLESYLDNPQAKGSDRLRAVHILGNWAGLNQSQKAEPQSPAEPEEDSLKSYLEYLKSCKNANGNSRTSHHD
jgi:hypothetical protein